jgi:uncharacterized protein (TIGR03437 family)
MPPAAPVTVPVTVTIEQSQSSGSLTLSPTSLTLTSAPGGQPVSQTVSVSAPQGSTAVSFTAAAVSQGNWLSVTPNSGATPTQLQITASAGLLGAGTYNGTVNITPTGGTAIPFSVTFTIGSGAPGQGNLTTNPSSLTFSVTPNSGPSAVQTVTVSSASAQLTSISAVPATSSGGNWLTVTPLSGVSPLSLSVSVNPQGLVAGSYAGAISLNSVGSTDPPVSLPVTLTVQSSQSSNLTANPATLTFNIAANGSRTQSQTVSLSSSNGSPIQVSAAVLGAAWVAVNPPNLSTPGTITVSVNANGIADGTYQATVNLTSPGAAQVSIPITLNIGSSASGQFETFPNTLTFNVQSGQTLPGARLISVGGTGTGTFTASANTASGGSWLQALPASGSTPGVVLVGLSSSVVSSLAQGTYNGTVTVAPQGSTGSVQTIPVQLTVGTTPALVSNAPLLLITAPVSGSAPNPVNFTVSSTSGAGIPVQVAANVQSGAGWLTATASSLTTPANIVVTVNPVGLAAGTYDGTVTVSSTQQGVANLVVPVRVRVQSGTLLTSSSTQLNFTSTGSSTPAPQTINLSGLTGTAPFTATPTVLSPSAGSWLTIQPSSGTVPGSITISANPAGLATGDYAGTITVTSTGAANSPLIIPVVFGVTSTTAPGLTATPASLTFTQTPGGAAPPAQTLQLNAPTSTSFTATATTAGGGSWLSVNPASGQVPGTVSVIVSNTSALTAGTYNGTVTLSSTSGNITVPVTLTVGTSGTNSPLTATPAALTFTGPAGSTNPAAQSIQIATTAISPAQPFTAAVPTQSGGNWLSITPVAGTTPTSIQASVNLTGLTAGTYNGSITLTPQGAQPLTVPVTLTVTGGTGVTPAITSVVNAATQMTGAISPGLVVFIRGTGLGPVQQSLLQLDAQGRVTSTLSNVRVLFDGIPSPLIAVGADAISTVVPFSVAGRSSTSLVVEYNGTPSAPINLTVSDVTPGLFTLTGTGSGQGAILNQDLSINSSLNPAARGSIAVLYMTGNGILSPSATDGEVTSANLLRKPVKDLQLRVGGIVVPATGILYNGAAPATIVGVTQVNFVIPNAVSPGNAVPVEVAVGGIASASTATIAVR